MPLPPQAGRSAAAVLLLYVLPLAATVVVLVVVGLPVLALGLVVVEAGVVAAVALARRERRPRLAPGATERTTSGARFLLLLGAAVAVVVGLLVASRPG